MSFETARKEMAAAEKALTKIRTARAELEKSAHDAQGKLEAAIVEREAALTAGKVADLPKHGAVIENARITIRAAADDLEAISKAEHDALGVLVAAEKLAREELRSEWDSIADEALAELVAAAAPALQRFWLARYRGNYPISLEETLRSGTAGIRDAITDAAREAPEPEFALPEHVESALLSHADRAPFQRHALG
jgi:hypothetical protein